MIDASHKWNTSLKPLVWGFILSLILTCIIYYVAVGNTLSAGGLLAFVLILGTIQSIVQFAFFLQIFIEPKPRWNLMVFLFMLLIIVVLVGGSIWIMHNIDYNAMGARF